MNNTTYMISNGYINIDNITEEKGEEYSNWIKITKQKLKERECQLMSVRITALQNVINEQCEIFENINSTRNKIITISNYNKIINNNNIIDECLNKLYLLLSLWNGVNLTKTKKSLSTFRKYFSIGKCWFDQKKKNILAPDFYIKFFLILEKFTINSADIYFKSKFKNLQILYSKHLLFQILSGIFSAQIHFTATKPQPLISCAIIKDSNPMKKYLNNLHNTLNINKIIQKNSNSNSNSKINAKELLDLVNKQLVYLTNKFHNEFQIQLKQTFEFINTNNNCNNAFADDEKGKELPILPPVLPPILPILPPILPPITPTTNNYNYEYENNHCSSQSVISQRYNPINNYCHCCNYSNSNYSNSNYSYDYDGNNYYNHF